MSIESILDKIWLSKRATQDAARDALPSLTTSDLRDICLYLLDATCRDWLIAERQGSEGLLLRHRGLGLSSEAHVSRNLQSELRAILFFPDANACLVAMNPDFVKVWGDPKEYKAVSLLQAMQFARDRSDSLLLLPVEMREREFRDAGAAFEVSEELLKALAMTVHSSEKKLAN